MSFLGVRGSRGLLMIETTPSAVPKFTESDKFAKDTSKNVKVMCFSPAGDLFAWSNGTCVQVCEFRDGRWSHLVDLAHSRVTYIKFSPLGNLLASWEVYSVKQGQQPTDNLFLWNPRTGKQVASFTQKKAATWCPQWTADETLCCLKSPNNEVNFYKDGDFSQVEKRLSISKMNAFSLSPGSRQHYPVVCFVPGQKGGAAFGKMFNYPALDPQKNAVAHRSFFQAESMSTSWSHCGRMALLLMTSEVDKTGASYYGKQQLFFMSVTGDTELVSLAKEGPIYSNEWSPTQGEFAVVYGYMPAKATLYNAKCEKLFDYGTGPRNMVMFNPLGNILMLSGFGNLRGNVEMWSVKDKKQICQFEASDSTDVKWSPKGDMIMTSTCAPRLRMGNGLKVWHYTGSLLHEELLENASDELWEVVWRNLPKEECPLFPIQYRAVEGIKAKQPQASKVAYRPPGMRNKVSNFKLHDEDEPAENLKKSDGDNANLSKAALKNKKRKEAAAKKRQEEASAPPAAQSTSPAAPAAAGTAAQSPDVSNLDPEAAKKVRKLNDKLAAIQKLKAQQKEGKTLEKNQLEKIKTEQTILDQIKMLTL